MNVEIKNARLMADALLPPQNRRKKGWYSSMSISPRARRRRDRLRVVARAQRLFPPTDPGRRPFDAEKLANNLKHCQHPLCQNPRRHLKGRFRLPLQEQRAIASAVSTIASASTNHANSDN